MKIYARVSAKLALCAMLSLGGPLSATAQTCASALSGKKVVFGEPDIDSALPVNVQRLKSEVVWALESAELWRAWEEPDGEPVAFLWCQDGRMLSRAEWLARVDDDYRHRVLVEVRSIVGRGPGGGQEAKILYLVAPVGRLHRSQLSISDGYYMAEVMLPEGKLIDIFSNPLTVNAFLTTSLGLQLLHEGKYDLALANLCNALGHLDRLIDSQIIASPDQVEAIYRLKSLLGLQRDEAAKQGSGQGAGTAIECATTSIGQDFERDPCLHGDNHD